MLIIIKLFKLYANFQHCLAAGGSVIEGKRGSGRGACYWLHQVDTGQQLGSVAQSWYTHQIHIINIMTGSIKYQSLLTGAFTCVPDENKAGVAGGCVVVGIANLASVYTVYEIARLSTRCQAPFPSPLSLFQHTQAIINCLGRGNSEPQAQSGV